MREEDILTVNCKSYILLVMDEIKEMLKAVINGQHALRSELVGEISKLRKEMNSKFEDVGKRFDKVDERFDGVDDRLDRQGKQLAYLDDDVPTREEFDSLESRVDKLEKN